MVFRENETEQFPFNNTARGVWYAIITSEPMETISFTSSKSGKRDLVDKIKQFNIQNKNHLVLGIWQGQWKTDIFILNEKICINKINQLGD